MISKNETEVLGQAEAERLEELTGRTATWKAISETSRSLMWAWAMIMLSLVLHLLDALPGLFELFGKE